jgi:hypothetical protein
MVRSKVHVIETAGVEEFREARSKFLERKKEEDMKVKNTKT